MINDPSLTVPHEAEVHDWNLLPLTCGICGHRVWRDEAGALEHVEAGDPRGKPVPVPTDGHGGATVEYVHFPGCPTPEGEPYGCDYCQGIAAGRSGT